MAERREVRILQKQEREGAEEQTEFLSLQRLQTGFHNPSRHDISSLAHPATQVAVCDVPAGHGKEGHIVDAVVEGNRSHVQVGLVPVATDSCCLRQHDGETSVRHRRGR